MRAASHFADAGKQIDAAKLGMWVFVSSESLLFAGLFALFVTYQTQHAEAFIEGVHHNTKLIGSINTGVLLLSSFFIARAVQDLRADKVNCVKWRVLATVGLGAAFLVFKALEYELHFAKGIYPAGHGRFFEEHRAEGLPVFWTLYFTMTGLHALHVIAGMVVLLFLYGGVRGGTIGHEEAYRLELGAIYWHLVDVVWIFLWPLFYLA